MSSSRMNTVRGVSAIGAGVLLASTPHCGGKSVEEGHDSNDGGTQHVKGGASGSAGTDGGYGGFLGTGGSGGTGTSPYGGYGGTPGIGGTGGSVGTGGSGIVGIPPCNVVGRCWTPTELRDCWPDAGVNVDAGPGTGIGGEGGAAAEPDEPPMRIGAAPNPNVDAGTDSGSDVGIPEPPVYDCPVSPPFPQCVMPAPGNTAPPPYTSFYLVGFTGTQCCYNFEYCR